MDSDDVAAVLKSRVKHGTDHLPLAYMVGESRLALKPSDEDADMRA